MHKTIDFLNSLKINKDDYVIVACSGGPDSMCLLYILNFMNYKVVCVHINHNIRKESKGEFDFVKKYCSANNIIFEGTEFPKEVHKNESYYRQKRYNFYKSIAQKYKTKYIVTAHHGDDLIETILMRITRGSNLKGYSGFSKIYDEGEYIFIKPLIFYSKSEILTYNKQNNIPYVIDKTNYENNYTRNRYRHYILPHLKKELKQVNEKYLEFSEEIEGANNYIEKKVKEAIKNNYDNLTINLQEFIKLDQYIQVKELQYILKNIYKDDIYLIKNIHIQNILKNIELGQNFTLNMPLNYIVKKEYGLLKFGKIKNVCPYTMVLDLKNANILPNGGVITAIKNTPEKSNNVTRLNSKDLSFPLKIRNRVKGDRMEIKNMEGSKKIKSIFIDEKINPSERDEYPILIDNQNRIIWLPGIKKSKFDNENTEKYDIILEYTKEREKI